MSPRRPLPPYVSPLRVGSLGGDRRRRGLRIPSGRARLVVVVLGVFVALYVIGLFAGEDPESRVAGVVELPPSTLAPTTTLAPPTALIATRSGASLPAPLTRASAVADGAGGVVVVGGRNAQRTAVGQVLHFDPAAGTFRPGGPLTVGLAGVSAVTGPSGVRVLGGAAGDKVSAGVQTLGAGKAAVTGSLPEPRTDAAAAVLGSTIYVVGGFDGTKELSTVLASDDEGATFRVVGRLATANRNGALVAARDALYLIGGEENGRQSAKVLRIDPLDGSSTQVALLPGPLSQAGAFVLDRSIFVAGGRQGGTVSDLVVRIDLDTGLPSLAGTLPEPVAHPAVAVVGEVAYLFGGETTTPTGTVMELRPVR